MAKYLKLLAGEYYFLRAKLL